MRAGIPPPQPPPPPPPPPDQAHPQGTMQPPLGPCTPPPRRTMHPPPGPCTPLPAAEHAGRYGQRVGGTHPTRKQSCVTHKVGITTPVVNSCPVEIDVKS